MPYPIPARFQFPSPGYRRHSNASKVPGGCWNVELIGTLVTLLSIKLTEYLRQESSIKQITTTTVEMPLRIRSRWILIIAFLSFSSSLTSLAVIFNVPFTWENKFEWFNQRKFPQHWRLATNLLHKRMKGVYYPSPPQHQRSNSLPFIIKVIWLTSYSIQAQLKRWRGASTRLKFIWWEKNRRCSLSQSFPP